MKFGIIGRTRYLLDAAEALINQGYKPAFVYTCNSEDFYNCQPSDYELFASKYTIPFYCDYNINQNEALIKNYECDFAISMNWISLLGAGILNSFKLGVLNFHAGNLPRYKGNACPNWAILNGEPSITFTVHSMSTELDHGPIYSNTEFFLTNSTYIGDIYSAFTSKVPDLFIQGVRNLVDGKVLHYPNQSVRALRTFPRRHEDSKIDWGKSTTSILALIRSSSHPFSGAHTTLENNIPINIFYANIYTPDYDFCAIPGQVTGSINSNPLVATSNGMIEIIECRSEGLNSDTVKKLIIKSLRNRLI